MDMKLLYSKTLLRPPLCLKKNGLYSLNIELR